MLKANFNFLSNKFICCLLITKGGTIRITFSPAGITSRPWLIASFTTSWEFKWDSSLITRPLINPMPLLSFKWLGNDWIISNRPFSSWIPLSCVFLRRFLLSISFATVMATLQAKSLETLNGVAYLQSKEQSYWLLIGTNVWGG